MNLEPLSILLSMVFIVLDLHGSSAETTCSKNCKPLIQEKIHCDENTGECSEGCNPGYYGTTCDEPCQCGGGTCEFLDGTCIRTSTVTPDAVSPDCVSDTQDSNGPAYPVVVCCLCLLVVILTLLIIFNGKEKILKKCKRKDQPSPSQEGDEFLELNADQNSSSEHELHDESAIYLREPSQKWTDSQRKLLVDKLGVHLLNPEDTEPVVLFCAHMKFDYHRVNRKMSRMKRDHILWNEPASSEKKFPVEFKNFHGTTSLFPIFPAESPTYFEVDTYVHLNKVLGETDLLMSVGLCSETHRDLHYQIKLDDHCYNLNAGPYNNNNKRIYIARYPHHSGTCSKRITYIQLIYSKGSVQIYRWNRCVLSLDLKAGRDGEALRSCGREFHRVAAAYENEFAPKVFSLYLGTTSRSLSLERRDRSGLYKCNKSCRYAGPMLEMVW